MGMLARRIGPVLKPTRIARANLRRILTDKSPAEIETIIGDMWEHFGRMIGEFPHIDWITANRVEVIGGEYIDALRDDGDPGLFVSGHIGNWELAGACVCQRDLPIALVYRSANNPYAERLYRRGRGDAAKGGQIAKGPEGAREILKVLKSGGHLGILIDQKMNDGIAVPFLGVEAMTAPAVARFALKFGCPLVTVRVERLGGVHFRATVSPPRRFTPQGDTVSDTLQIMTQLNEELGNWIRQCPEQWLWFHRRWPREEIPTAAP